MNQVMSLSASMPIPTSALRFKCIRLLMHSLSACSVLLATNLASGTTTPKPAATMVSTMDNKMKPQQSFAANQSATCCTVVELRQYTLHPGKRDTLIALFEREFIEPQEALGITMIGEFRDMDNPDRFVWLRGFRDMTSRPEALAAFYGGPVWKAHREVANATMIDSDNVLLLRPAKSDSGFKLGNTARPSHETGDGQDFKRAGFVSATLYYLKKSDKDNADFTAFFTKSIAPIVTDAGAKIIGTFITENAANNFPKLPVREGENVFIWLAQFASAEAFAKHRAALAAMPTWQKTLAKLQPQIEREETLRLTPTPRSLLPTLSTTDGQIANNQDATKDWDFFIGNWHTADKRLLARLKGSSEWETFEATVEAHFLPGGIVGNMDVYKPINWRPGMVGMTIRIFSPVSKLWSIYWLDNKTGGLDANGILQPPVVGKFVNGVGIFEGDDTLDGKPIRVRYTWSDITANSAKWEQAMSPDAGKTWETNWTMQHTRVSADAAPK